MHRRIIRAVALCLTLALLAGCSATAKAPAPPAAFKAAISTDVGGLNDDSFNASAWRGLQRAKSDLGIAVQAVESHRNEDYEVNFRTLIDARYNLVWGIGFLMSDALNKVAGENPKQQFGIIDTVVPNRPNVVSVVFKEEEGSFLMGVIAARTTRTKTVGFIGGMDMDVVHHFEAGFKAGVKAVDPTVKVITVYSGAFDDPAKGKSDALSVYGQGADVIFHAAGATGGGVIEAAKEQHKYVIGVDSDQNRLAPDNVLSSMVKRIDNAVFDITKAARDGQFTGGQVIVMGLKDNGVGYADSTLWNKMPDGTKALVDKWADAIKAGQFQVPNDPKQVGGWQAPKL
ncbi:MAG: BMP family lipoprotein [Mycobacterium leprae]